MKKGLSDIVCIIDKSGSMSGKESDVINGFNRFLREQKKVPGEARLSLILFDTIYEEIFKNINIKDVVELNDDKYCPSGMTALLDSVGRAIDSKGKFLNSLPEDEKPENVIIVIITDGQENSSKEYKKEVLKKSITHQQEKYNWKFIFLGANQDAFSEAGDLGIYRGLTANYSNSSAGINASYASLSSSVRNLRTDNLSAALADMADLNDSVASTSSKK